MTWSLRAFLTLLPPSAAFTAGFPIACKSGCHLVLESFTMRVSFKALILILPVVALQLHFADGACGDLGAALFGADGNALRAAAACLFRNTDCNLCRMALEVPSQRILQT